MKRTAIAALTILFALATHAEIKTRAIDYKAGDTDLQGYLAYDDAATGKRPAVMIIHEWWGLTDYPKHRAEQLAKLGYVAFAADVYGKGVTTDDPKRAQELMQQTTGDREALKQRLMAARDVLLQQPNVDGSKVAVMGYCMGGAIALEMARAGADVAGVVSFHGVLATQHPAQPGRIKAKVLVCHGAADPFVPPKDLGDFAKEMDAAGADWQVNVYSHAKHAFTNPKADEHKIEGISYNAEADRRSWEAMKAFFAEIFGNP